MTLISAVLIPQMCVRGVLAKDNKNMVENRHTDVSNKGMSIIIRSILIYVHKNISIYDKFMDDDDWLKLTKIMVEKEPTMSVPKEHP